MRLDCLLLKVVFGELLLTVGFEVVRLPLILASVLGLFQRLYVPDYLVFKYLVREPEVAHQVLPDRRDAHFRELLVDDLQ